jgi:hypothetical protein
MLAVRPFRNERDHQLTGGSQAIDEIGLRRAAKCTRQNGAHRQDVGAPFEPHVEG